MVSTSKANPNNKRLKRQDQEQQVDQNTMATNTLLPHLPDLIVDKIFRLIPTKLAVRASLVSKQWASVWSFGVPFLYFDDQGDSDDRRTLLFMDFVESCFRHFERAKLLELERFMLRMRYDSELIDSTRIDKWFSFVVDRCLKELYISFRRKDDNVEEASTCYRIPQTILNAQYLTHLNLHNLKIPEGSNSLINLPLLKSMTLTAVLFHLMVVSLWEGCPSIEHLSLVSCSFSLSGPWGWTVSVNNANLKFLQIIHCKFHNITIAAQNLECFVFITVFPDSRAINLTDECVKLRNISVQSQITDRTSFSMPGKCRSNLKAAVDIPNLLYFHFHGYLLPNDVIFVKAQQPFHVTLGLDWDDEQILQPPLIHFPTWRNFLLNFGCCNQVKLDIIHDAGARALTFPEMFRKIFSPPLPYVKNLAVSIMRVRCPQTMAGISAFTDSLRWMAPFACITLHIYGDESASSGEDE